MNDKSDLLKRMDEAIGMFEKEAQEKGWIVLDRGLMPEARERIAELEAALDTAATALNRVAWGGDFASFVDDGWEAVNAALDTARAALGEKKDV